MTDYRIMFEKTGRARFISHLDLNRCMLRAIRRSGLPAWYTEGFHPHMYLMFPLALSLGTESLCEVMDIRLTEERPPEEILSRLNAVLPAGLHAVEVRTPQDRTQDIEAAEYQITLTGEALLPLWEQFLAQPEILAEKRTKKGIQTIDLRPLIEAEAAQAEGEHLTLTLRLPAGNAGNVNVSMVTDAFADFVKMPIYVEKLLRTKIFSGNGRLFS